MRLQEVSKGADLRAGNTFLLFFSFSSPYPAGFVWLILVLLLFFFRFFSASDESRRDTCREERRRQKYDRTRVRTRRGFVGKRRRRVALVPSGLHEKIGSRLHERASCAAPPPRGFRWFVGSLCADLRGGVLNWIVITSSINPFHKWHGNAWDFSTRILMKFVWWIFILCFFFIIILFLFYHVVYLFVFVCTILYQYYYYCYYYVYCINLFCTNLIINCQFWFCSQRAFVEMIERGRYSLMLEIIRNQ